MSDIKSTRRLQIFISLESAAALNELVEYNHETITRAVEQSLIERRARLPHVSVAAALPIDTVEKYPASEPNSYCPRHRPKPCAADCEYRVNV